MRKAIRHEVTNETLLLTQEQLKELLNCGYQIAIKVASEAQCEVRVGRRVFYNREKLQKYLNTISI